MKKEILRKIVGLVFGRKILQPFFELLHRVSLLGMNFGFSDLRGSGEIFVIKYLARKLQNANGPILVFDVGANLGFWSQALLKNFKNPVNLFAFEPSQRTFYELKNNLKTANNFPEGTGISVFNIGFSDTEGVSILHSDKDFSGIASLYERNLSHVKVDLNGKEEVNLKTLDSFCLEQRISKIHLLKLDTEGHELNILKGAKRIIESSSIDFIQFEFGGCNVDSRTYFQDFFYFLNPKYKIYRICKDGLREIRSYNEYLEIFTTINYLAELRKT